MASIREVQRERDILERSIHAIADQGAKTNELIDEATSSASTAAR